MTVFRRCANFLLPAVGLRGAVDDLLNRKGRIPYLGGDVNTLSFDFFMNFAFFYMFSCRILQISLKKSIILLVGCKVRCYYMMCEACPFAGTSRPLVRLLLFECFYEFCGLFQAFRK